MASSTAYVHHLTLKGGHSDTVNVLVFSPDGDNIASGGDDKVVIIWEVNTSDILYRIPADDRVDSILWHPVQPETIIIGCAGGSITQIHGFSPIESQRYKVGQWGQSYVSSMDYSSETACLAASIGPDIFVAKEVAPNSFGIVMPMPHPPDEADVPMHVCLAATIKFIQQGRQIVATYPSHGVICWDVHLREKLWQIMPSEVYPSMGHSAVMRNSRYMAVHNFQDGVHLYAMRAGERKPRMLYKLDNLDHADNTIALQVCFIHNDRAVVCGTSTGDVSIWQVATGELFQSLPHRDDVIMAVAGCQKDEINYLATGSASLGPDTYIKVWRACIAGLNAQEVQPPFWRWLTQTPFSECFVPQADDIWAAYRVVAMVTLLLVSSWAMFYGLLLVPWGECNHEFARAAATAYAVMYECTVRGAHAVIYAHASLQNTVSWAVTLAAEWVRAQALKALGLPADIMERLPPN